MRTCVWMAMGLGVMIWISGCSRPADKQPANTPPAVSVGRETSPKQPAAPVKPDVPAEPAASVELVAPVAPAETAQPAKPAAPGEMSSPASETKPEEKPEAKPEAKAAEKPEAKPEASPKKAEEAQKKTGTGKIVDAMGHAMLKGFTGGAQAAKRPPAGDAPKANP